MLIYTAIILFFVVYQENSCISYNLSDFYKNNDTLSCMIIRYSLILYQCIILCSFILTIIAAYIVISTKTKNPYYSIVPKPSRSNVLIFIPVYSENKQEINNTIESVLLNDYPIDSKIMYIVVDGIKQGAHNDDFTSNYIKDILGVNNNISEHQDFELYLGEYKYVKYILVIKHKNKGKKDSFLFVNKTLYYNNYIDQPHSIHNNNNSSVSLTSLVSNNSSNCSRITIDIDTNEKEFFESISLKISNLLCNLNIIDYVLMLDTDTKVDPSGLRLLVDHLDSNPFSAAVCGETSVINKLDNLLTMSQMFEYYITHYTLKALENVYGNVLVLSGCFALYRKHILINKKIIKMYQKESNVTLYSANISQLGEDRLLTNLILRIYPDFNTCYIQDAKCYTVVPSDLKTLLCQRRRWTNSLIFCHIMLLLNTPNYNILKKLRFICILLFELVLVIFMPLLIAIGYYYTFKSIKYYILTQELFIIIQSLIFLLIPVILCIILKKLSMIKYALTFILYLPFYSIFIPLYSIYFMDDVSWGETRKTNNTQIQQPIIQTPQPIQIPQNSYNSLHNFNTNYPQVPAYYNQNKNYENESIIEEYFQF